MERVGVHAHLVRILGVMEAMQLASSYQNVEAMIWLVRMDSLACGAHVQQGFCLVHPLHHTDFAPRIVVMVDWVTLITTNVAERCRGGGTLGVGWHSEQHRVAVQ